MVAEKNSTRIRMVMVDGIEQFYISLIRRVVKLQAERLMKNYDKMPGAAERRRALEDHIRVAFARQTMTQAAGMLESPHYSKETMAQYLRNMREGLEEKP